MRKRKWVAIIFLAPLGIALFIWIGGELVLHLWNWLLPTLFGWRQITFWQALGLLALCRVLFGGLGGHGPRSNIRRRMNERMGERWERMTPEEREKFRQSWRSRCGGFRAPTSEPKEQ
jgi:Ca2+/H+ antiporter, TMEM165/GDT1 family